MEEWPRRRQYRIARPLPVSIFVLHNDVTKNKGRKGESSLAMRDYSDARVIQTLEYIRSYTTGISQLRLRAYLSYGCGHTTATAMGVLR